MIRRTLVLAGLAGALASTARAQPAPPPSPVPPPIATMKPPPGWERDATAGLRVVTQLGGSGLFGGAPQSVDAQVLTAPGHGAALIASQVSTDALPADPAAAATAALHDVRAGADAVDGARVVRWDVVVDPAGKLHEARLEWTDPSVGTTTIGRALVFRAGGQLARAAGECVIGPDGADQRAACEAALASIAPIATALEPLAVSATAPPEAAPVAGSAAPAPGAAPRLDTAPPTLRDGGDVPSTIVVRPPPRPADRRPLYVVGGLGVLGLVFWWNRRERQRREALEAAEEARQARRRAKQGAADADAADADAADADDAVPAAGADDGAPASTPTDPERPS